MDVLITHRSAVEYWRLHGKAAVSRPLQRPRKPPANPYDVETIERLHESGLSYPIRIMVSDPGARRASQQVHARLSRDLFPEGCLIDVGGGLLVASPELCFFQMANELPLISLLELALELCGSYALPVSGSGSGGETEVGNCFYNRTPLTSKSKLDAFLARMSGWFNQRTLPRILRYVADNSASPMETKLFLILTLPYKLGGYCLEAPELNAKVLPGKTSRYISSKNFFRCDLYWKDYDLAVEYDSSMKHLSPQELAADAMRRNSLVSMGVEVITVTSKQIKSSIDFKRTARQIAVHMGKRIRSNEIAGFVEAHKELRTLLRL